jgi:hypothetical protein
VCSRHGRQSTEGLQWGGVHIRTLELKGIDKIGRPTDNPKVVPKKTQINSPSSRLVVMVALEAPVLEGVSLDRPVHALAPPP